MVEGVVYFAIVCNTFELILSSILVKNIQQNNRLIEGFFRD